jgi:hypothetical protein
MSTPIVDLFDTQTKQAIWRGTATETVSSSPDSIAAALQSGLDKMLANYPPTAAAK